MTSEVLDIHALSPYDVTPQQTHDASPHSTSSLSLASNRQSAAVDESDVTWKLEEATLSRNTGAVLRKDQECEDLDAVPRASTTTADTKEGEKDWHPLQEGSADHTQEATVVVDLGESLLDANGRLRFTDHMDSAKSTPSPSPRNSHIKGQVAPSPPPWEVIGPPSNNGHREYGGGAKVIRPSQSRRLVPKSSYYFGPPPADSAFGTMPVGHIGQHYPREVIRVERDYTGGELIQFAPIYPLELEGRITPTKFLESINAINERLIEAHSMKMSALDNVLAIVTLYLSRLIITSHYDKEIERLKDLFAQLNRELFNPAGLNLLWPGDIAFLFMEIEYY